MVTITNENYEAEITNSDKPVLLDFGATWCVPCKSIVKIVEELDREQDAVKMAKVNIEDYPEIAAKHNIISIPALIFFKNGKPIDKIMGVKPKKAIVAMISK